MNDAIYKLLFSYIKKGLIITDLNFMILDCNEWITHFAEKEKDFFLGQSIFEAIPRLHNPSIRKIFANVLESGHEMFLSGSLHKNFIIPDSYDHKKDEIRQNLTLQRFVLDDQIFFLVQFENITNQHVRIKNLNKTIMEKTKKEEIIQKLIHIDPLTKQYNRRYLSNAMEEMIINNKPFATIFIDLDNFKKLNDDFGHFYGDIYLREFAKRLEDLFVNYDNVLLSRYAGDEFVVLLPGIVSKTEMIPIMTKLMDDAEIPIMISEKPFRVKYSAGVYVHTVNQGQNAALSKSQILKHADQAMYQAKNRTNDLLVDYAFFD